jgi:hypothetical protein
MKLIEAGGASRECLKPEALNGLTHPPASLRIPPEHSRPGTRPFVSGLAQYSSRLAQLPSPLGVKQLTIQANCKFIKPSLLLRPLAAFFFSLHSIPAPTGRLLHHDGRLPRRSSGPLVQGEEI